MIPHFGRTPTCDRQTQDDNIHRASIITTGNVLNRSQCLIASVPCTTELITHHTSHNQEGCQCSPYQLLQLCECIKHQSEQTDMISIEHKYVSVVNMVKSCCSAVILAVICLSVILLSLEADAQPTIDETMTCSASTLDEVMDMVKMIASNQQENAKEIRAVKKSLVSGRLEEVIKEIRDLKKLIALMPIMIKSDAVEPSEQALVSALVSNCTPLLIQQNDGLSNSFNRSWAEYKVGFGDPSGNYWLGNELLSQLTSNYRYKLKFDVQSRSNRNWYYAEYSTFRVLTEADSYTLLVAGYSGNASDALSFSNGMLFTTYDRDNDMKTGNCAATTGGGFWHKWCAYCDVNSARSAPGGNDFGWAHLPGGWRLQSSRMWLQCK